MLFFIIFLYSFVGYTFDYITDMQAKRKVISTYPLTLKKKYYILNLMVLLKITWVILE